MELYKVLAGSRLYGTNRPNSDYDYRAVVFEPLNSLIGLQKKFEVEQKIKDGQDVASYGLVKFCQLALGANPNILELLFAPQESIGFCDDKFKKVLDVRQSFLSQKIRKTFGGYALGQVKQLEQKEYKPEGSKAELIEKFGWDVKAGMHLYRLCYQGYWLLKVPQEYSPKLTGDALGTAQEILRGEWSKEAVLAVCKAGISMIDTVESKLPQEPDSDKVEKVVMELLRDYVCNSEF